MHRLIRMRIIWIRDYDDYDNEEEERIRRIKNKVLVRVKLSDGGVVSPQWQVI